MQKPARSVSPDKFCVIVVPEHYPFCSWALRRIHTVIGHLCEKESTECLTPPSVGHAVYRLQDKVKTK